MTSEHLEAVKRRHARAAVDKHIGFISDRLLFAPHVLDRAQKIKDLYGNHRNYRQLMEQLQPAMPFADVVRSFRP